MRILLLDRFWGGRDGPGIYIYDLAQSLMRRGHTIALVYGKKVGDYVPDGLIPFEIAGLHADLYGKASSRERLEEILREFQPNIASAQCLDVLWFARQVEAHCPLLATFHTHAVSCPNWTRFYQRDQTLCELDFGPACFWHTIADQCGSPRGIVQGMIRVAAARSALRQVTAVQAVTPYMRQMLERTGLPQEKIFDLVYPAPGFVADREYQSPNEKNILFVGRLHPNKGCHLMLEALAEIQQPWTATIVGGGPSEAEFRALAAKLKIAERCTFFTGQETVLSREQLSQLYLNATLICVPSIWGDPAPLVRLEAMAHGRPLVVFDAGGVAACVKEGQTGFIVPRLDVKQLREKIAMLLNDNALAEQMGHAALRLAKEEYNPTTLAQKTEILYTNFIEARVVRRVGS